MTALTDYLDAVNRLSRDFGPGPEEFIRETVPRLTAALRDIDEYVSGVKPCDHTRRVRRILDRITDTGSEQ